MGHQSVLAGVEDREHPVEVLGQVVGAEQSHSGGLGQPLAAHGGDVGPGNRQNARRAPWGGRHRSHPGGRAGFGHHGVVGQVRGQMGSHRHRAYPRSAPAMGDAKRLVQIEVRHVSTELAGLGHPHQSVEIGPVQVNLPAVGVDQVAHLGHGGFVHAVGGGVGDHQRAEPVVVLHDLGLQVFDVDVAVVVALDHYHFHSGHDRAGRIGAVGRGGDQADVPLGFAPGGVVAPDGQQAGQLALGTGVGLERHRGVSGDGH